MRSLRLFLLLLPALVLGISSCCEDDPFIPTNPNPPGGTVDRTRAAFVRIVHASATAPGTVVVVDDSLLFGGSVQSYLGFEPGKNEAKFYPIDTSAKRLTFRSTAGEVASVADMDLQKGLYYTFYLYGDAASGFDILRTRDSVAPKPGRERVLLRAVNLSIGSPKLDIYLGDGSSGTPIVSNLGYGEANEYVMLTPEASVSGLTVKNSATGDKIYSVPNVKLIQDAIFSLVLTGSIEPKGNEPMLMFSMFGQDYFDSQDSLYGSAPLRFYFAAVRFANLVPSLGDSTLSVAFLDSTNDPFVTNEFFRKNYPGQAESMVQVAPLGNSRALGMQQVRGYMLHSTLSRTRFPFRIEFGGVPAWSTERADVLAEPSRAKGYEFRIESNQRYTIVAYGPKIVGQAKGTYLHDNTRAPSSNGMTTFRFFHGGFGPGTENRRLQIRIGGAVSPLMGYGDVPDGATQAAETAAGATVIDLLDESGAVLHTETLPTPLEGGKAYTIFLSRGADGNSLVLTEVSEALKLVY